MAKKDLRIDAYIAEAAPFARPILKRLRKLVHQGCPAVEETLKWGHPSFTHHGMLCGMAAFKEHCTFGFWKQALLEGGEHAFPKAGEAMGSFGRIASLDDLPPDRTFVKLVEHAAALNESGVKTPRAKREAKPPVEVPAELAAALKRNAKARKTFEAFSPSHRREYVEWITEAKTEATRQRRLATTLEWLAEGKPRNWKYMR